MRSFGPRREVEATTRDQGATRGDLGYGVPVILIAPRNASGNKKRFLNTAELLPRSFSWKNWQFDCPGPSSEANSRSVLVLTEFARNPPLVPAAFSFVSYGRILVRVQVNQAANLVVVLVLVGIAA